MATSDATVVMAHGGWADGSSWARVITGLAAHGIKGVAAPLPLTDLADDVEALNRSIERMPGPLVWRLTPMRGRSLGSRAPSV
jgi:hypothetical protein